MTQNIAEIRVVKEEHDTIRKMETAPPICPALEATIVKLASLESALERLDANMAITNKTLQNLTVAIGELTNAMQRR